ncbi:MAG TPA: 23S rRNA (pseudouridine(1915)-N(3))-methyltransferase RlmH [Candidatus Dormibacteraeota bacterium]|nr:23S rRNA (pseudouridine(1915)-N(3))-methyltransferase RlmH [Candidatus Dormibacteraeota bacterium]
MRICLLLLGKTRRPQLREVFEDYIKRISHHAPVEVLEVRNVKSALQKLDADRAAEVILLDATGRPLDSDKFAKWLAEFRDRGQREIIFLCGDADGFPPELRSRAGQNLSLSAMTFSHELARVMLAEQLYRAFAILSGSPYPK